jgi:hypothetical protein
MRIFLLPAIRRFLAATNIIAILTVGPCTVLLPQQLAAQHGEPEHAKLDPTRLDDVVARIATWWTAVSQVSRCWHGPLDVRYRGYPRSW